MSEREIYRGGSWRGRCERRGLRQGSIQRARARNFKSVGRELRRGGAIGHAGVRRRRQVSTKHAGARLSGCYDRSDQRIAGEIMDYNIENKGFVCFAYNLQRRRAFWTALLAVLAVKFILCELFLGGAVADALVVKLRFATLFAAFGAKSLVGFI